MEKLACKELLLEKKNLFVLRLQEDLSLQRTFGNSLPLAGSTEAAMCKVGGAQGTSVASPPESGSLGESSARAFFKTPHWEIVPE